MTVEALRMIQAKDPLASFDGGETFAVHATEVRQGATRLQGEFYGSDGYRAAQVLILSGFDILSTGSLSEVLWFGPFARTYVDSSEHGLPFLTSSEMLVAAPDPNYISTALTKDLDRLRIKKNNILVSCSGSIGNTTVCNADQDGWAVSQDAIRVIPNEPSDLGVLATCFFSGAGQFLLTRCKSGSVVEHIYASDIEAQPIPHLPIRLKEKLTELVLEAGDLRVDANRLIAEAKSDALKQVGLAEFHSDLEHLEFETFVASSSLLRTTYEKRSRIRLESTFHNKRSVEARKRVEVCQKWKRLEDVVEAVPFTGPGTQPSVFKVEKNQGVPCVTGRDLGLSRPRPSSYITSQTRPLVEKMIPKPGTTLVMCAGTLGKTEYCWGNYEGWAVSLDVIRVIPDPRKLHPGFVFAFLSTELGREQMLQHRYGSVIPRIHSRQVREILIPIPDDSGHAAGEKVNQGFDKRAEALTQENRAIALFDEALKHGRERTEAEWGRKYSL